jgi:hypothetical protein
MDLDWSRVPERWTYEPPQPTRAPVCAVCGSELTAAFHVEPGSGMTVTLSHPLPARAACLTAMSSVLRGAA